TSSPSALGRTLYVWLLSNLGGTALLIFDFSFKYPTDLIVPLVVGLMVALLSLVCVPLAWPFFALSRRTCSSLKCRMLALAGVLVVFAVANLSLLHWLPIGPLSSLLSFSRPYLGAAILAVAWLYRPREMAAQSVYAQPVPASLLHGLWWRKPSAPTLAR
ncbi:MAG TPA: hypothetical protein VF630_16145, partial [Hymenobacter sp.]